MTDDDHDTDDIADEHDGNNGNGYATDPHTLGLMIAVTWCRVANNKTLERTIRKLDRLDRKYADTKDKLTALTAQAAEIETALTQRVAAIDERERAQDARDAAFASQAQDVRAELRGYYNSIASADRHLRYRILSHAGMLSGYNPELQDLATWDQMKRLIVGLPDDPPPIERDVTAPLRIDAFADVCSDPNADRHGNVFLGTLNRDVSHKGAA
jgi:hypothetical protein